jgi:hypothetical protein
MTISGRLTKCCRGEIFHCASSAGLADSSEFHAYSIDMSPNDRAMPNSILKE